MLRNDEWLTSLRNDEYEKNYKELLWRAKGS